MQKMTNITKEDAGFVLNPDAELAQVQTLPGPWWVPSGLQPPHHADEYKYSQHLNPNTCLSHLGTGEDQQKSEGDKINPEEKDSQNHRGNTTNSSQPNGYFQIQLGQPMVSMTNSPHPDQLYGLFPGYGPQPTGSVMLPMGLATDDGTVYVNPKQYHRILCRRKIRATAALKLKARQAKDKPYVHESRHLHAMRRPRGAGGRFLTSKELQNLNYTAVNNKTSVTNKTSPCHHDPKQFSNPSRSSSSEVLQGDTGNLSSPTSKGKPNPYGSEVTSVLYSRQLGWFPHPLPSSVVVEDDHGCCNFLKT